MAARIGPLLNDLPSECGDAGTVRATLLDCFQDRQAAQCRACQRDDYFAWQETREGESARQIRQGIVNGAWKNVNLSSWKSPLMVKIVAVR